MVRVGRHKLTWAHTGMIPVKEARLETTKAPQKDGVMVKNSGPLPERVNGARIQGGLWEGRKG